MATTEKALLTAEEFMNSDLGDGTFELFRGEVIELTPPNPEHGRVCLDIGFVLELFGRRTGHGFALSNDAVILTERNPDTVRGPDVSYFSHARWPRSEVGRGFPPVAPDLAVEVYSPSNRPSEMQKKVSEYLAAGALLVWIVHPARRTVAIYRHDDPVPTVLREGDTLEGFPELPGFRCPVAELFA